MSSRIGSTAKRVSLAVGLIAAAVVVTGVARPLKLTRLEAPRVERLSPEARRQYELGLAAIDKILYAEGLVFLQQAIDLGAEDDHLRFMIVQLATYLGDTRMGNESAKFYAVASDNLRALANSPRLNNREKARAQEALEKLALLQQSIAERDENRRKWGLELGKMYQKELQEGFDDAASNDLKKRKKSVRAGSGNLGTVENYLGGLGLGGSSATRSDGPINRPSTPDLTGRPVDQGPTVNANDAASASTGAPTNFDGRNE